MFLPWCFLETDFKCWVQENVRHGPSVSLKRCKSSSALFGCCFPRERRKSSPSSSEDTVPGESPNIQGIKHHLACESLPLFLTPRAVFYFPFPHLLPSSASEHYKRSVSSLWFSPKVLSFILSPACSPLGASHWSVFNLFFCALLDNDASLNTTRLRLIDFYNRLRWVGQIFFRD